MPLGVPQDLLKLLAAEVSTRNLTLLSQASPQTLLLYILLIIVYLHLNVTYSYTQGQELSVNRVQVAGLQRSLAYGARVPATIIRSLPDCLAQIYRTEGLRGLYKGSTLSIVKAAPAAAVTLAVYEFVSGYLLALAAVDRDRKL